MCGSCNLQRGLVLPSILTGACFNTMSRFRTSLNCKPHKLGVCGTRAPGLGCKVQGQGFGAYMLVSPNRGNPI